LNGFHSCGKISLTFTTMYVFFIFLPMSA
jgi:hypothetical protein